MNLNKWLWSAVNNAVSFLLEMMIISQEISVAPGGLWVRTLEVL